MSHSDKEKLGWFDKSTKPKLIYSRDSEYVENLKRTVRPALQRLCQWLPWRLYWERGSGKWTKVPYSLYTLRKADYTDSHLWCSFEEVLELIQNTRLKPFDGVGFALHRKNNLTAIDLDDCRNPETGAIAKWAWKIIRLFNSYTELSPSGTGIRIFIRGTLPKNSWQIKPSRTYTGPESFEVYCSRRWVTVSGCVLQGFSNLQMRSEELNNWYQEFPKPKGAVSDAPQPREIRIVKAHLCSAAFSKFRRSEFKTASQFDAAIIAYLVNHGIGFDQLLDEFIEHDTCPTKFQRRIYERGLDDATKYLKLSYEAACKLPPSDELVAVINKAALLRRVIDNYSAFSAKERDVLLAHTEIYERRGAEPWCASVRTLEELAKYSTATISKINSVLVGKGYLCKIESHRIAKPHEFLWGDVLTDMLDNTESLVGRCSSDVQKLDNVAYEIFSRSGLGKTTGEVYRALLKGFDTKGEIINATGMPRNSVHKALCALEMHGLAHRLGPGKRFVVVENYDFGVLAEKLGVDLNERSRIHDLQRESYQKVLDKVGVKVISKLPGGRRRRGQRIERQ